jgi:hypothetical protein
VALKAVVETLDDVPEALHAEYVEKDGKFYLEFEGESYKVHPAIQPLANALTNAKKERDTIRRERDALKTRVEGLPDDFDADRYAQLIHEDEERKKDPNYKPGGNAEELQRMRQQLEQRLTAAEKKRLDEIAAKDVEIQERDATIRTLVAEEGLQKALVQAGVDSPFLPATQALLSRAVKVEVDEESGRPRAVVETDLGTVPVEQYVENWAKSDAGKVYVRKPTGGGAGGDGRGATNGSGKRDVNPWAPTTRNLTEQGRLVRDDKQRAERLMREAKMPQAAISRILNAAV